MALATEAGPGQGMPRSEAAYVWIVAMFAVVLVLTNIVGVKLFVLFPEGGPAWLGGFGPVTLTTGIVTYPLTFLATDVVSEIWGKKRAHLMVVLGFVMSLLMLGVIIVARALPPSPFWVNPDMGIDDPAAMQHAFDVSFTYPGLLLFASMSAYLVAQLFDVRLYHFWWKVTGGRHMWVRNNGSTMISQLLDTAIVNSIYLRWGLGMEWDVILSICVAVYLCKVGLALLDTPLIYLARRLLRDYLDLPQTSAPAAAPLGPSTRK